MQHRQKTLLSAIRWVAGASVGDGLEMGKVEKSAAFFSPLVRIRECGLFAKNCLHRIRRT
jgi:hypothetical protein